MTVKKCDIIIPVWNELKCTRDCIEGLKRCTRFPYRLIVVDNGSHMPTLRYLEGLRKENAFEFLLIRNSVNLGFVKAVNQGIRLSSNPYIVVLNNDTLLTDNWLASLIETVETGPQNIGMANPTSNVFGKDAPDGKVGEWQELDSCRGFCMLIKRELIDRIGLFDEVYSVGYFEEKDFSRRAIEAGYICIRAKASFVFHRDRVSFNKLENREEIFKKNESIFNERWGRPQNIAFVAIGKYKFLERKTIIYKFLDKGHRVHLFFSKDLANPNLKDHINIKYFPLTDIFFGYLVLYKLWERRRKKKIDFIIAEDPKLLVFFKKYRFIHKAEVKEYKDLYCHPFCVPDAE